MIEELKQHYASIFEKELLEEMDQVGTFKIVSEGVELIQVGNYIKFMPLIISGALKILRQHKDGDELLLYFLERGNTCAMTLSCCLGDHKSEIRAIAEKDTKLLMIPIQKMEVWTRRYTTWRRFIFQSYHQRLIEALETIDSIAFMNMDERLIKYLNDKMKINQTQTINNTHQQIADELHTSRVVVSRLLKKLEHQGKVQLSRNSFKIINL